MKRAMRRDMYDGWPSNTERLFHNIPASGRDVEIANYFAKRASLGASVDDLADLLAAYRVEQEEKLEQRIGELQEELDQKEDLAQFCSRCSDELDDD